MVVMMKKRWNMMLFKTTSIILRSKFSLIKYEGDSALDKKTFMALIKRYLMQMKSYLSDKPERFEIFKTEAQAFIKKVTEDFGNFDFYHPQIDYDKMDKIVHNLKEKATEEGKDPEKVLAPQEMIIPVEYVVKYRVSCRMVQSHISFFLKMVSDSRSIKLKKLSNANRDLFCFYKSFALKIFVSFFMESRIVESPNMLDESGLSLKKRLYLMEGVTVRQHQEIVELKSMITELEKVNVN